MDAWRWRYVMAFLVILDVGTLGASDHPSESRQHDHNQTVTAIELRFSEREPGLEPYQTRMLVTEDFLRIDEGLDDSDFVLFDRHTADVLSVSLEGRSAVKVGGKAAESELPSAPVRAKISIEEESDAPKIAGKQPQHVQVTADGLECLNAIVAPGLLDDARIALRQFAQSMAVQHATNLAKTPVEMHSPCLMVNLILEPGVHLEHGLPIREWDHRGFARALVDFQEAVPISRSMLSVPSDFSVHTFSP